MIDLTTETARIPATSRETGARILTLLLAHRRPLTVAQIAGSLDLDQVTAAIATHDLADARLAERFGRTYRAAHRLLLATAAA